MDDSALAIREVQIIIIQSCEKGDCRVENLIICQKKGDQVEPDQMRGVWEEQYNLPPGTNQVFHCALITSS